VHPGNNFHLWRHSHWKQSFETGSTVSVSANAMALVSWLW